MISEITGALADGLLLRLLRNRSKPAGLAITVIVGGLLAVAIILALNRNLAGAVVPLAAAVGVVCLRWRPVAKKSDAEAGDQ